MEAGNKSLRQNDSLALAKGISKPVSRKLPSHEKIIHVLRQCLQAKKFGPLRSCEKFFRTKLLGPHAVCYLLLEQCFRAQGNENIANRYALLGDVEREKEEREAAARIETLAGNAFTEEALDAAGNGAMELDETQSSEESTSEAESEERPTDLVDYVAELRERIASPTGTYEVLLSQSRSKLNWSVHVDNAARRLEVALSVSLDASFRLKSRYGKQVRGTGSARFRQTDDTNEGSLVHRKAANRAAKVVVDDLKGVVCEIESGASAELRKTLSTKLKTWRSRRYVNSCLHAFRNAKRLILEDSSGDKTVHRYAGLYGCKVLLFGSVSTGLTLDSSDVDIALVLPKQAEYAKIDNDPQASKRTEVLCLLRQRAVKAKMANVWVVETAKVPVLRYRDPSVHVDVDISISKDHPVLLSRFIRRHLQQDPRVWELCMLVKYWAKQRRVCGTPEGYINPTGWTIMTIFFLQHKTFPPVASLFRVKRKNSKDPSIVAVPWRSSQRNGTSAEKAPTLLKRFFKYFGNEFDFRNNAVSLNLQDACEGPILRKNVGNTAVFIEQPLQMRCNVVSHVSLHSLEVTKRELRRAHFECLTNGRASAIFGEREIPQSEMLFC